MQKTISMREFRSPAWRYLAFICIAIAVIFGVAYWITDNTFWAGIFRLMAFAGFAAWVLVLLQLREKPKTLQFELTDTHFFIRYYLNEDALKEELFERKTILNIEPEKVSQKWNPFSKATPCKYIITFTDTDTELSMLTFGGRNLWVSEQDAAKLNDFFARHDL